MLLASLCLIAPLPLVVALQLRAGESSNFAWAAITYLAIATATGNITGAFGIAKPPVVLATCATFFVLGLFLFIRGRPSQLRFTSNEVTRLTLLDALATGLAVVTFASAAWLSLALPVTNFDSLAYHLPTLAHWVQAGALDPVAHLGLQRCYPMALLTAALPATTVARGDMFVSLVGLLAYPLLAVAVYQLGRQIGSRRIHGLLSVAIVMALPVLLRGYGSVQPDAMLAALFIAALAHWIGFCRSHQVGHVAVFALAVALLPGMKSSGLVYATIALGVAALTGPPTNQGRSTVTANLRTSGGLVVAIVCIALASFWAIRSVALCGNPFGVANIGWLGESSPHEAWSRGEILRTTIAFSFRFDQWSDWTTARAIVADAIGVPFVLFTAVGLLGIVRARAFRVAAIDRASPVPQGRLQLVVGVAAILCLAAYLLTPFSADNGAHGFRLSPWSAVGVRYAIPFLGCVTALAASGLSAVPGSRWVVLVVALFGAVASLRNEVLLAWPDILVAGGVVAAVAVGLSRARLHRSLLVAALPAAVAIGCLGVILAAPRRDRARPLAYGPFFEQIQRLVPASAGLAFLGIERSYPLYGSRLGRKVVGRENPGLDRRLWQTDRSAWEAGARRWWTDLAAHDVNHLVVRTRDPLPQFDGRGADLSRLLTESAEWTLVAESGDVAYLALFARDAPPPRENDGPAALPPVSPVFMAVSDASGLPQEGKTSGIVVTDLNRDALPDLLLGRHSGAPQAYENLGGLRFAHLPDWSSQIEIADHHATVVHDFDGDGCDDYYFVVGAHRGEGVGANALHVCADDLRGDLAESWGIADRFGRGRGGLVLDLDRDRVDDLVVTNFKTAPRSFALMGPGVTTDRIGQVFGLEPVAEERLDRAWAAGEPTFELRRRGSFVYQLLPADFDADGLPDFVAFGGPPIQLLMNGDRGCRADFAALPPNAYIPAPVHGTVGDFDGDSDPDLFLVYGEDDAVAEVDRPRRNRLLLWQDDAFVEAPRAGLLALDGKGVDTATGDLNNDGWLDLVLVQAHRQAKVARLSVYLNSCAAEFVPAAGEGLNEGVLAGIPDGLLLSDLDVDGDLDLLVLLGAIGSSDPGGGIRLYRNDLRETAWLEIQLVSRGGSSAYGTTVSLRDNAGVHVRQHLPTQVRGSSFEGVIHFGLGEAGTVDEVLIEWPGGGETVLRNVQSNQRLRIEAPGP